MIARPVKKEQGKHTEAVFPVFLEMIDHPDQTKDEEGRRNSRSLRDSHDACFGLILHTSPHLEYPNHVQ